MNLPTTDVMDDSQYKQVAVCLYNYGVVCSPVRFKVGKSRKDLELAYDAADCVCGGKEEWIEAMTMFLKDIIE